MDDSSSALYIAILSNNNSSSSLANVLSTAFGARVHSMTLSNYDSVQQIKYYVHTQETAVTGMKHQKRQHNAALDTDIENIFVVNIDPEKQSRWVPLLSAFLQPYSATSMFIYYIMTPDETISSVRQDNDSRSSDLVGKELVNEVFKEFNSVHFTTGAFVGRISRAIIWENIDFVNTEECDMKIAKRSAETEDGNLLQRASSLLLSLGISMSIGCFMFKAINYKTNKAIML